jgi:hypothetical protein
VCAENLLAATVAAYIFFLISYQLPQTLERKAVGPSIAILTDRVVQSVVTVLFMLHFRVNAVEGRATLPDPVTEDFVTTLFKFIAPNSNSISHDALGKPLTWFTYVIDESAKCLDCIDQVRRYARFIDAELAARLDDVRLSQHVAMMARMREYRSVAIGGGQVMLDNPE